MKIKNIKNNTNLQFKILFVLFPIILISIVMISYHLSAQKAKEQLAQRCHTLASTISVIISEDSNGYEDFVQTLDTDSQYYIKAKDLMIEIKNINIDNARYIYTVNQVNDRDMAYILGGEEPYQPNYTKPGTISKMTADAYKAFTTEADVLGDTFYETPYGDRLTSYAPIFHKDTGEFMGLVGADVVKSEYTNIVLQLIIQSIIGALIGIFIFTIVIWWIYNNINLIINREMQKSKLAGKIVNQGREHYEQMDELQNKLQLLNHDYKYHASIIKNMIASGHINEANNYLIEVEDKFIDTEILYYCENQALNALLVEYKTRCNTLGIPFEIKLKLPTHYNISNYDLCIILSNILDNAVTASKKVKSDPFIKLETRLTENQLLFMISNKFDGNIEHKKDVFISQKENGGFGIISVKEIIAEYDGDISFEWDNNTFTVFIALKYN